MAQLTYLNFDLTFESNADGYAVRVTDSPAGQAGAPFLFPFNELELENFLLRLGQRSSGTRRADSPEMELSKQFGGRLFDALFDDDVRAALRSSIRASEEQGAGLRIRLRFGNTPELADIPWEYLYDGGANRFLTLSRETPLVRYLELSRPVEPLQVQAPLRILVMISDPSDYERLDVEAEWQRLNGALADLRGRGLVEIVRQDKATLLELQRLLRDNQFHIFHYIGHGVFDESADDGFLVLEEENGRGRKVSGQYVGTLLADHRSLRLALLNSCEGGRSSRRDPYAGAAQSLVQQGLPAVIAMQFEISDDAAAVFAQEFYMALAGGYPVDAALAEGRRAIFATKTNAEWGIPVLFMRAADGRIFDVQATKPLPKTRIVTTSVPVTRPQVAPSAASSHGRPSDTNWFSDTLSLPKDRTITTPSVSLVKARASVVRRKNIGTILGGFLILALLFYLLSRVSLEQATPPPTSTPAPSPTLAEPAVSATQVIESNTFPPTATPAPTSSPTLVKSVFDNLPDLAGRVVVAVTGNDYTPLNFIDPATGKAVGWEYDAVNEICRRLNCVVDWKVTSWEAMIPAIARGEFDVGMDGITITDEREQVIDFSVSYMTSQQFMLVRADEERFSNPASFTANDKLLVGAQGGTTGFYTAVYEILDGNEANPRILLMKSLSASVHALMAGDVDLVLVDAASGRGYIEANPGKLKIVGDALATEDFGFIFTPGSDLIGPFNAAIHSLVLDNYDDYLNTKWFFLYDPSR